MSETSKAHRSKAKINKERDMFGCHLKRKPGWSFMGRVLLAQLDPAIQRDLQKKGDAVTLKERDRYIQYVNYGEVTASTKLAIINFYRRLFKGRR
jgi:hypothetical protein